MTTNEQDDADSTQSREDFIHYMKSSVDEFNTHWTAMQESEGKDRWPDHYSITDWHEQFIMWLVR